MLCLCGFMKTFFLKKSVFEMSQNTLRCHCVEENSSGEETSHEYDGESNCLQ